MKKDDRMEYKEFRKQFSKREKVLSGRIPAELWKMVSNMVDGKDFKCKNDVLEDALMKYMWWQNNRNVEGC